MGKERRVFAPTWVKKGEYRHRHGRRENSSIGLDEERREITEALAWIVVW
jgi:hypothetical protein